MSRNDGVLGISVIHGRIAFTLMKGGVVRLTDWEEIPSNIVDGNKVISQSLFADFLREKLREKKIKCKLAAYVIPDSEIFVKNISMPKIDEEQLRYNIPFEFKDLIRGELNQYVFDYVKRNGNGENETSSAVKLLAYAVPIEVISNIRETLKQVGLKLVKALPETSVYETMISAIGEEEEVKKERCFMDIGRRAIRMMVFKNGEFKLSHLLDIGEERAIQAIADDLNVDAHLAGTYLRSNYQDCDRSPAAINAFKDISVEILRGLNFYEMSDMTSRLNDVVLCGTGAMTEPLVEILKQRIDQNVVTMDELFPKFDQDKGINVTYASVGVLLSDAVGVATNSNLAVVGEKKKTNGKSIAAVVGAIAVIALLVGKFGIYDRLNALSVERQKAAELQKQIDEQTAYLLSSEELVKEYYHYTWEPMSDEEKERVSRLEAFELVDLIAKQGMRVKYMNIASEAVTVDILAADLDSVSKLTTLMQEQDIVESCNVLSAKTLTPDELEFVPDKSYGVLAELKMYLTKGSSDKED